MLKTSTRFIWKKGQAVLTDEDDGAFNVVEAGQGNFGHKGRPGQIGGSQTGMHVEKHVKIHGLVIAMPKGEYDGVVSKKIKPTATILDGPNPESFALYVKVADIGAKKDSPAFAANQKVGALCGMAQAYRVHAGQVKIKRDQALLLRAADLALEKAKEFAALRDTHLGR